MRGEDGAATILAAFALSAMVVIAAMFVHLGGAVAARHHAQSAADLGALAGAHALAGGTASACDAASALVSRMGAAVSRCEVDGWNVVIAVSKPVLLGPFGMPDATAVARAGPVD